MDKTHIYFQLKRYNNMISGLINTIGTKTSLAKNDILLALELSLEQAVCEYFNIRQCQVYVENKIVIPVFHVPCDMKIEEAELFSRKAIHNDLIAPELDFEMLHKDIIVRCKKLFSKYLVQIESDEMFRKWKNKAHHVVDGAIEEICRDKIEVRLEDNAEGVMPKPEWVPKERKMYQEGKVFKFYVSKAMRRRSGVVVFLSRGSKNLPAALLKDKIPWLKIKTLKRIRGKKTWLKADSSITLDLINEVRRELKGEALQIET